jgi:hypothetical protein
MILSRIFFFFKSKWFIDESINSLMIFESHWMIHIHDRVSILLNNKYFVFKWWFPFP